MILSSWIQIPSRWLTPLDSLCVESVHSTGTQISTRLNHPFSYPPPCITRRLLTKNTKFTDIISPQPACREYEQKADIILSTFYIAEIVCDNDSTNAWLYFRLLLKNGLGFDPTRTILWSATLGSLMILAECSGIQHGCRRDKAPCFCSHKLLWPSTRMVEYIVVGLEPDTYTSKQNRQQMCMHSAREL